MDDDDLLESFLSASEELADINPKGQEINTNNEDAIFLSSISTYEKELLTQKQPKKKTVSLNKQKVDSTIHKGDTDSSDDEQNRDATSSKYNEFGKALKHMLIDASTTSSTFVDNKTSTWKGNTPKPIQQSVQVNQTEINVYTDPVFGIRIIKPLVSQSQLKERMTGRIAVPMISIKRHVLSSAKNNDWAFAGVLVHKITKTSKKGKAYSIWTLSDLHSDLKTVSLFLFDSAYRLLCKQSIGTVLGVLNPTIFENQSTKDEACLSIRNFEKVMILGQSKDLGTCRSTKKDGDKCTSFVNVNKCEYCMYHIKQEYQKFGKRTDLQSALAGKGLTALRNKVLGKSEVFYGGKSFTAIPANKSKKLMKKDENRLNLLSGIQKSQQKKPVSTQFKKAATVLEPPTQQRIKDIELLQRLGCINDPLPKTSDNFVAAESKFVTLEESKCTALSVIANLKTQNQNNIPKSKPQTDAKLAETNMKNGINRTLPELNKNSQNDKALNIERLQTDIENNPGKSKIQTVKPNSFKKLVDELDEQLVLALRKSPAKFKATNLKDNIENNLLMTGNDADTPKKVSEAFPKLDVTDKKSLTTNTKVTTIPTQKDTSLNTIAISKLNNMTANTNVDNKKILNRFPNSHVGSIFPTLSKPSNNTIDLSAPAKHHRVDKAKLNALKWVQKHGPIEKRDPNSRKAKTSTSKKRSLEELSVEVDPKKQKLIQENEHFSERFKKIMAAKSINAELMDQHYEQEKEKYFQKLEARERMEEKMSTTYKVNCKAVTCLQCKYTNFSASDFCKTERHPLKVTDAVKRFFACGNCKNRTACLTIVPTLSCKQCGSSKWERTTMMKEKQITQTHVLSIRGGEQKFTNSGITDVNINLLVPDE